MLSNDTDADADRITAELVTGPAHGNLASASDGSWAYRGAADWSGTDTFTYRAFDGTSYSPPATVTIAVTPVNDAPVALADSATVAEDTTITVAAPGVLSNDTDADADRITAELVTGPAHGNLASASDGSWAYRGAADWSGTDTFTYRAFDGTSYSPPATVTIAVTPVAPTTPSAPPAIGVPTTVVSASTPKTVKRARTFYVTGRLSAAHPSGTRVTLRFERYYRKRWRVVKRTSVAVSPSSSAFRYRAKLSPRGSWRVIVAHAGDGVVDIGSASVTRRFKVR